jgi:hypothetical protein
VYEAIADAIRTTDSTDPALATTASDFLEMALARHAAYGPSSAQVNNVVSAIKESSKPPSAALQHRIITFMGIKLS